MKTEEFPWTSQKGEGGAQIDLAIERADGVTDLLETKFTDKPFAISADYEAKLLNKVDVFRDETGTRQALKLVMLSAAGISGVAHAERIAKMLTIDDLFD